MTMTFFGQEGTKNGATRVARFVLLATFIFSFSDALAGGYGNTYAETTGLPTAFATATYGFDPGANTPPTVQSPTPQAPTGSSYLYPGRVGYNVAASPSYRVRQNLTLEVTRYYTFDISPQRVNVGTSGGLSDGWYLVRFVLVLPNEKYLHQKNHFPTAEQRFLTSQKVLGYLGGGNMKVTVPLTFPDMQFSYVRSNLYVQITPLDQSSIPTDPNQDLDVFNTKIVREIKTGVRPVVSAVLFVPAKDADSKGAPVNLSALPNAEPDITRDLDAYVIRAQGKQTAPSEGNSDNVNEINYATGANLKLLDPDSSEWDQLPPSRASFNHSALREFAKLVSDTYLQPMPNQIDPNFARSLCAKIALMQGEPTPAVRNWIQKCAFYPYFYLTFHKNIHVRSLNTAKTSGQSDVKWPYQVISNLSFNESQSTDLGFSIGLSPQSLFPLSGFGEALQLLPISVSGSAGQGNSTSIARNGVSQTFMNVQIIPISTDLPINRYRSCVSIAIDENYFNHIPIKVRGFYVCDQEQQNLTFSENFYFVYQDTSSQEDASPQAAHFLFRGDRDMNTYFGLANDLIRPLESSPMIVGATFNNAYYLYSQMPGAAPLQGVITLPMAAMKDIKFNSNPGKLGKQNILQRAWYLMGY